MICQITTQPGLSLCSSIQTELDTHLNVLHIALNRNYDQLTCGHASCALDAMKTRYGRNGWHFTSPSGVKPDLHHALLGNLGGGMAFLSAMCNGELGFGVSAGLVGKYRSMSEATVYDMWVVSYSNSVLVLRTLM